MEGGLMAEEVTRSLKMAGEWWLPEKYEGKKLGTLEWLPLQGCMLTLVDDSFDFNWELSAGVIVGLNTEQQPITLYGCSNAGGWNINHVGKVLSYGHNVRVDYALVGVLFESEADIALTDLYTGYAGLDEYVIEKYYKIERIQDSEGRDRFGPVTFSMPTYETAKVGEVDVSLYVGYSIPSGLQLQHKLHFAFPESNLYKSKGKNFDLVHEILPSFLSTMMGHQSFLTSLGSRIDKASIEVFDGYHERMSWDRQPQYRDRLVQGREKTLNLWPTILPVWVKNYQAIANLCSAYIKIMSDDSDGFFEVNNLVHLFFGLERYYKEKRNKPRSSLWRALKYAICRIDRYFENIEEFISVADSIDIKPLNAARNTLVHSNEDEPDYQLVYQQLMFITRCILLMEMEYPVANVLQETQHWSSWQFFAERRKA